MTPSHAGAARDVPAPIPHPTAPTCATCAAALAGPFCHACGERVVDPGEYRFSSFLLRTASGAFDLDSRGWHTLRQLATRPGRATADYMQGRRRRYLSPLQAFLLANLIFFAALGTLGGVSAFTTLLRHHQTQPFYGATAARLVAEAAPPGSPAASEYEKRFNEQSPRYANSMVIVLVPLFAVGLALQFLGGGRPFAQHFVFSLHFLTVLLLVLVVAPLLIRGQIALFPATSGYWLRSETPVTLVLIAIFWPYLALSLRTAYDTGTGEAVLRGLIAMLSLAPVVTVYRALLFFTVYLAMRR